CIGTNGELMWLNKPQAVYSKPVPLYTHPAVAQVEPVATKLETQQFNCFHVSAEDFQRLKALPVGAKLYTEAPAVAVNELMASVLAEVAKATAKFPTWPTDPLHAVAVLGEEFGELTKAVLQHTYEPHKSTAEDVRTEAVQTAAMAIRFLMSLDKYKYTRGEQHSQAAIAAAEAAKGGV
ncbi:MAG TPA: hypothetical protein VFV43_09055, partial [Limnobacter sp.]|nr:hypothetical protein [Limnobacter sp.]